jgi:hypothetical protein
MHRILVLIALVGCAGPMPQAPCATGTTADAGPPPMTAAAAAPADTGYTILCTPDDLCEQSVNQCGATLTMPQCIGWYANRSNCRDMGRYLDCNCDCLSQMACSAYFSCGTQCFNTHCK